MDLAVPADHRINLKESKYLDLASKLKKLWNMKVTIIPITIGSFGTVTKGLLKGLEDLEIRGRLETTQTTILLRTAGIPKKVLETCCHSNSSERPSAEADVKNSQGVNDSNKWVRKTCQELDNNNNNNNVLKLMSVPTDNNTYVKEYHKISKYKEIEIEKTWHLKLPRANNCRSPGYGQECER